ncbi:substrate-binding periplasmic protein [Yeosuana marina]|uniref:substrate-binding periplasmic protein n=1 Tax=Yeosuana marina TaxID=1565536 RepID=UPI00141E39ED|nr:transporter substrate-binding domain-containing protein [Yeosuana marina]
MDIHYNKRCICSVIIICFSLGIDAQISTLKLASDIWPPFTNESPKKSIALDIVNEALSRNNIHVSNKIIEFKKVLNGIADGKFDGSGAIWKTPEREHTLLFSDAYLENRLVLVGLKGMDVSFTRIAELTNRKIGLVQGYAYDKALKKAQNLEIVYSNNDQENLEKLLDKKIDYMLVDQLLIQYLLKYQINDVQNYLSISEKPFQIRKLHMAIRKDYPHASEIISKFNKTIKLMMLDGSYTKILNLESIQTDVNGDGIAELVINSDYIGEKSPRISYNLFYDQRNKSTSVEFFVNGKIYNSWDQVPKKQKTPGFIKVSDDFNNPGLRIKLN